MFVTIVDAVQNSIFCCLCIEMGNKKVKLLSMCSWLHRFTDASCI